MKNSFKKPFIFGLGAIFLAYFCFISVRPAQALNQDIRQVRTKENSAVYFLSHSAHRKKAYLNADVYLDYGNKWSDVKFVSAAELDSWPVLKLIKTAGSPSVYYINGNRKTAILSWNDMQDYGLEGEPIVTVSPFDLAQYQAASYEDLGLVKSGNLLVFNDLVTGTNANTILTNTNGNLMGVFRFRAPVKAATLTSITFDITGLYSSQLLDSAFVLDANNAEYDASVSISQNNRRATVNFRQPLEFNAGEEKTVKLLLNLATCSCDNQTIRLELKEAASVKSSLGAAANFPLRGTEFKILSGANILGQVKSQEESVLAGGQGFSVGNRLIGKFILTEESGREEASVKKLVFRNGGTAAKNDWEDFRLFANGQIIARVDEVNDSNEIVFPVNYLVLKNGTPDTLTIVAALKDDFGTEKTVNLGLDSLWAVGKTYGASISPQIYNFEESFTLN